jgi:hypothetical protein
MIPTDSYGKSAARRDRLRLAVALTFYNSCAFTCDLVQRTFVRAETLSLGPGYEEWDLSILMTFRFANR